MANKKEKKEKFYNFLFHLSFHAMMLIKSEIEMRDRISLESMAVYIWSFLYTQSREY